MEISLTKAFVSGVYLPSAKAFIPMGKLTTRVDLLGGPGNALVFLKDCSSSVTIVMESIPKI